MHKDHREHRRMIMEERAVERMRQAAENERIRKDVEFFIGGLQLDCLHMQMDIDRLLTKAFRDLANVETEAAAESVCEAIKVSTSISTLERVADELEEILLFDGEEDEEGEE